MGKEAIARGIVSLLKIVRPTAIPRLVIAAAVDTVNRVFWRRSRSHVGVKRFNRIQPTVAHSNAFPAISGPANIVGVGAAFDHQAPNSVLARMAKAVDRLFCAVGISDQAAATSSAGLQISGRHDG